MKIAVAALATAAAVVSAIPNGGIPVDAKIACEKPNVNFCLDSTTLVNCDANKVGTRAFCRESMIPSPPTNGIGLCWQSSKDASDAVCHKACVVYHPTQYTIPASLCNPTYIPMDVPRSDAFRTPTQTASLPAGISTQPGTASSSTPTSGVMSIPEGTSLGTATIPHSTHGEVTGPTGTSTGAWSPTGTDDCPVPTETATATGRTGNNTTSHTTSDTTVPTAGASTNHVIGALAAAGFLAAFFF
ncbi:uncharacterized protein MAM_05105 [Metarhizium album ARSEF 1941]|uniref:Uncharacterized protein n=1 Tax=Metarhizium album (strain ARSEF 1941) TaxID=1081103 RepID=A0A0B2WLR0_METAS|nr:uncharacterized protein MAM_05105 [Metarhizium album ARSEF 1941]KHN96996.1 hypothetical protein MAM_05105 [Metarhizium album ARSEF 1941]